MKKGKKRKLVVLSLMGERERELGEGNRGNEGGGGRERETSSFLAIYGQNWTLTPISLFSSLSSEW